MSKIYKHPLKAWSEKAELTQTELADKLGCNQSTLSLWYNGKSFPSGKYCTEIDAMTKGRVHFNSMKTWAEKNNVNWRGNMVN